MPRAWLAPHRSGRRWLRPIWLSVAAVIVAALSGCSEPSVACTLIGSLSGVGLTVDPALLPATAPATVTACVVVIGRVGGLFPAKLDLLNSELAANSSARTVTQTVIVQNNGWFSEQIRDLDASMAGIEVLRTSGHDRDLPRNQIMNLVVVYRVTDCAKAPTGPIPIRVHIRHAWGTETTTLRDEGFDFTNTAHDACRGAN